MSKARSPEVWDSIASKYDDLRPDQGLISPTARAAWRDLLAGILHGENLAILDVGCGTGSLSLLLAEMGHRTYGTDFSPEMIAIARKKAKLLGSDTPFTVQDASAPDFPLASLDAIICRQVLWALPDPAAALRNWSDILKPGGKIVLVEGLFASGNGMSENQVLHAIPDAFSTPVVVDLSGQEALWGGAIPDQRLLITASKRPV